jgi:hypothetical protein
MYTHGLLAIISTKKRYGGFARAVGLRGDDHAARSGLRENGDYG